MKDNGSFSVLPDDIVKIIISQSQEVCWILLNKYFKFIFYNAIDTKRRLKVLEFAAKSGNIQLVNTLLQIDSLDPSQNSNSALQRASEEGHLAVVERLLQDSRVDPSYPYNLPIIFASSFGHLAVVERLLQDWRVDPSDYYNNAIQHASCHGHLVIVERLLQDFRVDTSAEHNSPLQQAANQGHTAIMERLLGTPQVGSDHYQNAFAAVVISQNKHSVKTMLRFLQSRLPNEEFLDVTANGFLQISPDVSNNIA